MRADGRFQGPPQNLSNDGIEVRAQANCARFLALAVAGFAVLGAALMAAALS